MIHHHFDVEPKESVRYSPHTRTLSDYPLLIGEVLRRNDLRRERRTKRVRLVRRIEHIFGKN